VSPSVSSTCAPVSLCFASVSVQTWASAIWPTAAAAWLSSSRSEPRGSFRTLRPMAIAPEDTTSISTPDLARSARSSISASSQS
jgi:hypothetical protein